MSLEGLRAWIGEVERKLAKRTRVFLVLTVIAIGIGGAAIYLAIDARESSVSESDVQALQQQLEAQIGTGGGVAAGAGTAQLEAELRALQAEVAELKSAGGDSQSGKEKSKGTAGAETGGGASSGATGGDPSAARLQELLEQSKERPDENE